MGKIQNSNPKHIAIIPDGNRRWARSKGISIRDGYEAGARKAEDFFEWSIIKHHIPQITLYSLSTENIDKRLIEELDILVDIYERQFYKIADDDRVHERKVKLNFLGELSLLPYKLTKAMDYATSNTKNYSNHIVNFLMCYGGRWEIIKAIKNLFRESSNFNIDDLTEDTFSKYLIIKGIEPDMVIRTAEKRFSNFLLWQTAYSEVFFIDKYWPDFMMSDFENILKEFSSKKRSFGK